MNYSRLAAELERPEYAALPDTEIAEALNAPGPVTYRPVLVPELASAAYGMGLPVRLRLALRTEGTPPELAAVCESLLDLLKAPFPTIDFFATDGTPDPASAVMLQVLLDAELLSEAEAAALLALAVVPGLSRAQVLGLGPVTAEDVKAAWAWQVAQAAEWSAVVARL